MPTANMNFFTATDYMLSLPMIILAVFAMGILLIDLMVPPEWKRLNAFTALIGLGFSAVAVWRIQHPMLGFAGTVRALFTGHIDSKVTLVGQSGYVIGNLGAIRIDTFAVYFFYLFLAGAAIAILMSMKYLEVEREDHGEYYSLMLFSVIGMMCMAAGMDIILLFIGLELMALSTYVLVGFLRRDRRSNEAALKYLLLGAFSSGIFAYGLSLIYGLTGSTNLEQIAGRLAQHMEGNPRDLVAVLALLTTATGLLFKIAAVPFHQWAPDAYEGAPTAITGFMSVAVKAAGWAMLLRIFLWGLPALRPIYVPLLLGVAVLTLIAGNLAALTQTNTKRLLAYSSISHVGYMLLGLVASDGMTNSTGIQGILVYLLVYTFMNLGAFAVITSLRRRAIIGDEIDDLSGLYFKAPVEAVLLLVFLLSLAGIPPLAGFWGKYFIFLALIQTGHYVLASFAVLFAVLGLYYYARIFNAAFMRKPLDSEPIAAGTGMRLALFVTGVGTIFIGMFPNWFLQAASGALSLPTSGILGMMK